MYRNMSPRESSMKDVFRSGDSSQKFKIAEGQWYRYAPSSVFFFKQKTAYEIGLGIPAEPLFRSENIINGFNRTLDAINNVFRKFSAFHDETGRLNVDGMNIISNDGSNKLNRSRKEIGRASCRERV